ncbi:MAG: hypothetical protein ABSC64_14110 [Candidatus Korobacteraceae bacterium]|jgi:hypothetical protein
MAKIKELIAKAGGAAEDAVASAKTHYVDQVRAILRDLTRLKFTDRQGVESQHTSVPIRVISGLPQPLEKIGEEYVPSGEMLGIETIGLWAHDIKSLRSVSERLKPLVVALAQTDAWRQRAEQYSTKLNQVVGLADELASYAAQAGLLKRLTEINEDILGVYMPTARLIPDRGQIEIYWVVIGAVARLLGVDTEALAVVVITHELAHAYTHVGLDSNSNRWEEGFWGCDGGILEGLAQFYTHMTVLALKDERGYERVWTAYDQLTRLQGVNGADLYVNHLNWVDTISPETMRQVLLDLRRGHIERDFDAFCAAMKHFADRYPLKRKRAHS